MLMKKLLLERFGRNIQTGRIIQLIKLIKYFLMFLFLNTKAEH